MEIILIALLLLGLLAFFGVRGVVLIGKLIGVFFVLFLVYIFLFPNIGSMLKDTGKLMAFLMIGGGFLFILILLGIWVNQEKEKHTSQ
ncbi:MAG: hypothetical protein GXO21_05635 [Aquificae bacterium]|nr:hypothetical protein [Aquificota bacterium]